VSHAARMKATALTKPIRLGWTPASRAQSGRPHGRRGHCDAIFVSRPTLAFRPTGVTAGDNRPATPGQETTGQDEEAASLGYLRV
jgi:hypothetical protein